SDVDEIARAKAKNSGLPRLTNQTAIDMLQAGDVLVVDLFGKKVNGTIVGDNLFYYVMKATNGGGLVVDGSIRDLNGISEIDMPAYFRSADPTPIGNVMLTGINLPVRIGGVTVMPGDLVVGDREGVYFIPPKLVREVLDRGDERHLFQVGIVPFCVRFSFNGGDLLKGRLGRQDPAEILLVDLCEERTI